MKNKRRGVSVVESRQQTYCFLENTKHIPECFENYDYVDLSACDTMDELLSAIMDEELSELVLIGDKDKETLFRALMNKLAWINKELTVRFLLRNSENQFYKEEEIAAQSVYDMLTGNYGRREGYTKTKQLYLADKELISEINLCDEMELNSEIFLPIQAYDENLYQAWKKNYYNHIHFIGEHSVYLDGGKKEIPFNLCSYAEREQAKPYSYLKLESKEDYGQFIKDLEEMNETGCIQQFQFHLVNECKWNTYCNLLNQRRKTICLDKTVYSCSTVIKSSIGEDSYHRYKERERVMDMTVQKRKCDHCPAVAWCSHCSGVSEEAENEFCDLMKQHTEAIDYIQIKNVLIKLHNEHMDILSEKMEFSSYRHSLTLPEDMPGRKPITDKKYLFLSGQNYYCYDALNIRLLKLTLEQAIIMEALQKGYSENETSIAFVSCFGEDKYYDNLKKVHEILEKSQKK